MLKELLILLSVAGCLHACTVGEMKEDPNDCRSYFICISGRSVVQTCPPGLLYHPEKKACNHKDIVNCGSRPDLTPRPDGTVDCPRPHGTFPHPYDCHKFFQCTDGNPITLSCPGNLFFDYVRQECDYKASAKCVPTSLSTVPPPPTPTTTTTTSTTTPPPTTTPTTPPPTTPTTTTKAPTTPTTTPKAPTTAGPVSPMCLKSFGMFPDYTDCRKYFRCVSGIAFHEKCPPGLRYNPDNKACNDLDLVNCSGRRVIVDPVEFTRGGDCPRPHGTFPHPYECTKFIKCVNWKSTDFVCPNDLWFDSELKVCVSPATAKCTVSPSRMVPASTAAAPLSPLCLRGQGMYPDSSNCRKYYICRVGLPVLEQICPLGLLYNPLTKACNDLDMVIPWCGGRYIPEPAENVRSGDCLRPHGTFRHPADCHKFIQCTGHVPTELACPNNLYFNYNTRRCVANKPSDC